MAASNARLPDPSPLALADAPWRALTPCQRSTATLRRRQSSWPMAGARHPLGGLLLLLRRQLPLIGHGIWAASLIVLVTGMMLDLPVPLRERTRAASLLALAAPIVAAAGIALHLWAGERSGHRTGVRHAHLARVDLAGAAGAGLRLQPGAGPGDERAPLAAASAAWRSGRLVLSWLAPMLFLSALALALSVLWSSQAAIIVAFSAWGLHVFGRAAAARCRTLWQVSNGLWTNQTLLLALTGSFLALAFFRAFRQEQRYV